MRLSQVAWQPADDGGSKITAYEMSIAQQSSGKLHTAAVL